jgi:nitrogen regulatory protein PII
VKGPIGRTVPSYHCQPETNVFREKNMKKIEAVILPSTINKVKDALRKIGIINMTVSKVRKTGGQTSHTGYCRGGKYESKYEPIFFAKTKIEIEVGAEELEKVLGAIERSTEGNLYGDEKVFVYSLDDTMQLGGKTRSVAGN